MLNKLSSKLRGKKRSGSLTGGELSYAGSGSNEEEEADSFDCYSPSYAESLFPLDEPSTPTPRTPITGRSSFSYSSHSSSEDNNNGKGWALAQAAATAMSSASSIPEEFEEAGIRVGPTVLPEYEQAEDEFLESYEDYFDHLSVDGVRSQHYPQLDVQQVAHLDYATSPLFSRYQIEEHSKLLLHDLPCSSPQRLSNHANKVQQLLFKLLNARGSDYALVLTSGMQASMKLVATGYPFHRGGYHTGSRRLLLACQDTHEAIRSCSSQVVPLRPEDLCISESELRRYLQQRNKGLFAFASQSSVSGARHPLDWIGIAQQAGWNVMLDVSQHLPASGKMDVSRFMPDLVLGSLHYMLGGYPSGLAFLLVKRRGFFFEGLVQKARPTSSDDDEWSCPLVFGEDESITSTNLSALSSGLEHLYTVGLEAVAKRVTCLSSWLCSNLKRLKHTANGDEEPRPVLKLYGPSGRESATRGSILVFNLLDSTGHTVPASIVQSMARRSNLVLGTCDLKRSMDGFTAIRASLGIVSNFRDVYRLVQFLLRFRDEDYISSQAMGYLEGSHRLVDGR